MAIRKYFSEFGINMWCSFSALLQQNELFTLEISAFNPHLYLVLRRPRITIDPKTVVFSDTEVKATFFKQIENEKIPIEVILQNGFNTQELTVESKYPYTEYACIDETGVEIGSGKTALLLASAGTQYWKHLDLEVLYVGQSYGSDGSRNAFERLKNHSTLQGIYAEAIRKSPDQDIWLILCSFEEQTVMSFDGTQSEYGTTLEEDEAHAKKFLHKGVSEQQRINFTEAALIKYFQPEYNQKYKNTFPNPAHSTYSECYDLDINMVIAEIGSDHLGCRLWSPHVKANWTHFCQFTLNSTEERKSFFDFAKT